MILPNKNPRILIYDTDNLSVGSTRVFSYGLFKDLCSLGINVDYGISESHFEYDVVIYGKNQWNMLANSSAKVKGLIQPSDNSRKQIQYSKYADFWIVGSYDELDYYLKYKNNILFFPLIEKYNPKTKIHEDKECIIIGYHGNKEHLENFSPELISSLEWLSLHHPIKLHAIYDIANVGYWKKSRPDIEIVDIQWSMSTLHKEFLEIDIGIVPILTHIPNVLSRWTKRFSRFYTHRLNKSNRECDYLLQYKNNSNPGRIFVFQQFGIPVVAELSPAACTAIPTEEYGYVAYSKEGWCHAFSLLCNSSALRNTVAHNAYTFFTTTLDTLRYSHKILNEVLRLWRL